MMCMMQAIKAISFLYGDYNSPSRYALFHLWRSNFFACILFSQIAQVLLFSASIFYYL